jgi:hypothetical protein
MRKAHNANSSSTDSRRQEVGTALAACTTVHIVVGSGMRYLAAVIRNLWSFFVSFAVADFRGEPWLIVTETVMKAASVERGVASAAYSFTRFSGAALAPWLAGVLGERINMHVPF